MKISKVEGIGPVYAAKLMEHGIKTTNELLKVGASAKGRAELANQADVSEKKILEWVNRVDLMRVRGVGEEYSDLLEITGVDTVKELGGRNPQNLFNALRETNEQKKLVRRPPSLSEVQQWIEHARTLQSKITY